MKNSSRVYLGVIFVAFLIALIQVHHIFLFYSTAIKTNIDAAIGITTGHPHWRIYQNRILGPYLLKGIAVLFSGNYVVSYSVMMIVSLWLAGYQSWRVGMKLGNVQTGWFALVLLNMTFVALLSPMWLYPWDFIGLNIFLAFVDFVISERPWYWFCTLFAVAIFNRDSSQLIALWLILEPIFCRITQRKLTRRISLVMMLSGVLCIAIGQWIIGYLRTSMLVQEVGFDELGGIPKGYGTNYFWNLPMNLDFLQHSTQAESLVDFVYNFLPLAMFIMAIVFIVVVVYKELRFFALAMTFAVSFVLILMFGVTPETRVFIETIPLIVLGSCLLIRPS